MHSLAYVLDWPVHFVDAPELFCLDLYKEFDLDGAVGDGPSRQGLFKRSSINGH
jgi:hypothetical protein